MTTWGSRQREETWVTCFLLPLTASLLLHLWFRHILSPSLSEGDLARRRASMEVALLAAFSRVEGQIHFAMSSQIALISD